VARRSGGVVYRADRLSPIVGRGIIPCPNTKIFQE